MSASTGKKTTSTSKTSVKPAAKPKVAAKPAPGADTPVVVANPVAAGPVLKKQELIEKVVRASGAKKKDAKPVIEAMLEVLGDALADGREFNLQPMGKLKLNRTKETEGARIIVAKIRQSKGVQGGSGPVAAAAE